MRGCSCGIAHVMQTIKDSHEVVVLAGKLLRAGYAKSDTIGDAATLSGLARCFNRLVVVVESEELRIGECLCHQYGGSSFSAADIGDSSPCFQLFFDPVEGRNPRAHKIGDIAWAKELFAAMEDAVFMFMPAHSGSTAEGICNPGNRGERAQSQLKCAGQIGGTVFCRQCKSLDIVEAEAAG